MNWKIQTSISTLPVSDLEIGIEFYQRLGFAVEWRWPQADPTHAGLSRDGCSIMLAKCDPAAPGDVYFVVNDVAACRHALVAQKPSELASAAARAASR
ncbi:MAG: hypothetical protein KC729_22070, partial [Candidatus Eisenbacteria bacterium]|nr:hypothetical protein [Candidatus Eisenbacteria bacterium]